MRALAKRGTIRAGDLRYENFSDWFHSRSENELENDYLRIVNESNRLHHSSTKGTAFRDSRPPRSSAIQTAASASALASSGAQGSGSGSSSIASSLIAPFSKLFKSSKSNLSASNAAQPAMLPLPPLPPSWQSLPLDVTLPLTCQAFNQKANQRKNRYMDVVCVDQTRVKLARLSERDVLGGLTSYSPTPMPASPSSSPPPTIGSETGSGGGEDATSGIYQNVPVITPLLNASDYIHANVVDGFLRKRAYVCCQGVCAFIRSLFSALYSTVHQQYCSQL